MQTVYFMLCIVKHSMSRLKGGTSPNQCANGVTLNNGNTGSFVIFSSLGMIVCGGQNESLEPFLSLHDEKLSNFEIRQEKKDLARTRLPVPVRHQACRPIWENGGVL